jgi:Tfp pilus assembly PilM family ATPase
LPEGAVQNGVIKDPGTVVSALKQLSKKARFTTRRYSAVVGADPNVLIRPAECVFLKKETDMKNVVEASAIEVLPVDPPAITLKLCSMRVENMLGLTIKFNLFHA